MSGYRHGIYTRELPTSILPPVTTKAGLPVVFGTAPVHLATSRVAPNKPVLCETYAQAVDQLGFSEDWKNYTLCEVMYSQFALYNRAPVVFVNVLDPEKHREQVQKDNVTINGGTVLLSDPVLPETLVVKLSSVGEALKLGTDYEVTHDKDGNLIITVLKGGELEGKDQLAYEYYKLTPEVITKKEIIGGIDTNTGEPTGLETLDSVFTQCSEVPGIVLAPKFSSDPTVAAVMAAKVSNIVNHFKAIALCDLAPNEVKPDNVVSWKKKNNFMDKYQYVCWPYVKNGDKVYHMSTHALGAISTTDSENNDRPHVSPSNKTVRITGICDKDGNEIEMSKPQADSLNGQGITTAINFIGGWKLWGNRMACYPGVTDPKDSQISIRRVFNWHQTTFILTYWQQIDQAITPRRIKQIVDSENIRLNSLVTEEVLLGGRIEFQKNENATTNLIDGTIQFHTYLLPPPAARAIENVIEFDPKYFSNLFK